MSSSPSEPSPLDLTRTKPFSLPVGMQDYLVEHNSQPGPVLQSLIAIADGMPNGAMRLGVEAGTFLHILTRALAPRFVVEIGTFIGYSSLCMASALTGDGRMLCCDISREWTDIARDHWRQAGVEDRIELKLGPAIETLESLPQDQPVDLAFIDADKDGYIDYYEALVPRLGPHGLLAVDNTMWGGRLLDPADTSAGTEAVRAFNDHVTADRRTVNVTVPIGDGITLISAGRRLGSLP